MGAPVKVNKKVRERKSRVSYTVKLSKYEAEVLHDLLYRHVAIGNAPTLVKLSDKLRNSLVYDTSDQQNYPEVRLLNENDGYHAVLTERKRFKDPNDD